MSKYLELFENGFDETVAEKIKPENWPYVGYSPTEGVVFSQLPNIGPTDGDPINDSTLNAKSYGVWWTDSDIVASADNMTKIGMSGLPIHNKLRRGILNTSGFTPITDFSNVTVDEYSTVVVEVPTFYGRSWQYEKDGTTYNVVRISEEKIDDTWYEISHCYVNAWCNTYGPQAGVGGSYQTSVSLIQAREYSNSAGGVTMYYDLYKWLFIWLPVIEFGTFATTREYKYTWTEDPTAGTYTNEYIDEVTVTDINGNRVYTGDANVGDIFYIEGSIGNGLNNHPEGGYNVTTPGATLCLGNRTGKVVLTAEGVPGAVEGPCCAYSWRGFENVAGDIAQWIDGFITLGTEEGNMIYTTDSTSLLQQSLTDDQTDFSGYRSYNFPAELSNDMILPTQVTMGEHGDFLPANNDMEGMVVAVMAGEHNLSGVSDASRLDFGSVPRACVVGSVGGGAFDGGALGAAVCGPGSLGAGGGLSSGIGNVGFRTVFKA